MGQGLVELALVLPLFLLLLIGLIDFGFAFYTNMTLEYASREGARVASALANGGGTLGCPPPYGAVAGGSPNWQTVDNHAISAVQRVLESAGIPVRLGPSDPNKDGIEWIRVYKADSNGGGYDTPGNFNEWTYSAGGGPTVDGAALDFVGPGTPAWKACSRYNGNTNPDAVGIAIKYTKAWNIPMAGLFVGKLTLVDKTVMVLNPTYP
jgi:hypothetical protein